MIDEAPSFSYFRGNKQPTFVTRTELEAAKLFDYYRIAWDYEPRTFILERDENGNILEAFTPDFYLPDLELFIEVTEMKQALVTVKNRKVRKLREKCCIARTLFVWLKNTAYDYSTGISTRTHGRRPPIRRPTGVSLLDCRPDRPTGPRIGR